MENVRDKLIWEAGTESKKREEDTAYEDLSGELHLTSSRLPAPSHRGRLVARKKAKITENTENLSTTEEGWENGRGMTSALNAGKTASLGEGYGAILLVASRLPLAFSSRRCGIGCDRKTDLEGGQNRKTRGKSLERLTNKPVPSHRWRLKEVKRLAGEKKKR